MNGYMNRAAKFGLFRIITCFIRFGSPHAIVARLQRLLVWRAACRCFLKFPVNLVPRNQRLSLKVLHLWKIWLCNPQEGRLRKKMVWIVAWLRWCLRGWLRRMHRLLFAAFNVRELLLSHSKGDVPCHWTDSATLQAFRRRELGTIGDFWAYCFPYRQNDRFYDFK